MAVAIQNDGRAQSVTISNSANTISFSLGRQGASGTDGEGIAAGGTTGQVLVKASDADYDTEWSASGSGDMVAATYDPTSVAGDAFDMDNMAEGATNKILSSSERNQLTALTGAAGGTTGQIATKASSDDYDLTWADDLTVPGLLTADHIHGNIAGTLYIHVKNTSGGTLAKGTPVYVTGHVGSSDRAEVAAADQSDPAKMPAIALLADELADNGEGDGVIVGEIRTFDTDTPGYALNDELFVGTGALTATKPTTGAVQPVATVGRLQASTGVLVINCQGQRSPDETFAPALGVDDNYVTAAEKVVIGNTSGTNTGDQDLSALQPKPAEGAFVDGDKTKLDAITGTNTGDQDLSGYAQTSEINTLAGLNTVVADATLIDTTDSRLSDARDPNAHASNHTDGTDDIQSATNAQKGLATAAHITAIEANSAKLTCDTTNVTAAGALMDSEVTNLAQVKAFNSSDYATAAQGTLADSAVQPSDNISGLTNDSGYITGVEGTEVASTGEVGGSKFLREDGDGTCSWQAIPGGGDLLAANNLSDLDSAATARTNLGLATVANTGDYDDLSNKPTIPADGILGVTIDGAGSAITTGSAGFLRIPYDCTISAVDVVADQSGSIVVDVWKDSYANFPPTDADSITASAPPTLSASQKSTDATLTGWTTSLTKGDYLAFNVDSASTITKATVTLVVSRTS